MPSTRTAAFAALLALALAACSTAPRPTAPAATTTGSITHAPVVLISLDGFRADYLDLGLTPNIARIAREGTRASMVPSYPSLTFPNHYTLVTGLRPDHHGIIHNSMSDAAIGTFRVADRNAVGDSRWWNGVPIWVTAEQQGVRTASWAWPGSAAEISGVRPSQWKPYDENIAPARRIDDVLAWLDQPAATRPRLVTLYFEQIDGAGHEYGPDSPQVRDELAALDTQIGRLYDTLRQRGQLDGLNLIVVSDHGMASVAHKLAVEDMVPAADATVVADGQSIGIVPKPGREAVVEKRLLGAHEHYDCWRKSELPAHWHYGRNPRVPPIVCQMHEGWNAVMNGRRVKPGSHGFDPALPSMRALFVARGPSFVPGSQLPPFDNVDVYPMLTRVLGLRASDGDGDVAPLLPAMR